MQKGARRLNLQQHKEKRKKNKKRRQHKKTSSTPTTCSFLQGTASKPWMSNSLILLT